MSIIRDCYIDNDLNISTIGGLLQWRALHQPKKTAYTFLVDGESRELQLTYSELAARVRAVSALILKKGEPGQRAVLLYPPGIEYIIAFYACMYTGIVAVPVYPPRPNRSFTRLGKIIDNAQASLALTTGAVLSSVKKNFPGETRLRALNWIITDVIDTPSYVNPVSQEDFVRDGETLAFLQYTSGSTSVPKGVKVTHSNLFYNLKMIKNCMELTENSVGVFWLPPFHDMGLIGGIILPLFSGFHAVLMSPMNLLQSPFCWLQAISKYKGTLSGGPNYAYDLCVRKIADKRKENLDLSSWVVAFNGAEPVRAETMERFVAAFGNCGFRREAFFPCYGLAEATLLVSGKVKTEPPTLLNVIENRLGNDQVSINQDMGKGAKEIVGCGNTWLEQNIEIVNPQSLTKCAEGQIGEIWVRGSNVAKGYWGSPEATKEIFGACIQGSGEGPFLRTGDLGFMIKRELFVTGRIKDLIIIRGWNHYPQDIEITIENSHPALRAGSCAAFSISYNGEERLVLVAEVDFLYKPGGKSGNGDNSPSSRYHYIEAKEIINAIRMAVVVNHELETYKIVLIKAGSIHKTSSGKIQRHACKEAFQEGMLQLWEE
jgi:acyl-CoA synthetase (AMP-forming)/AMP-acid ligase II